MSANDKPSIHVVAGVLLDDAGRFFIAQRPPGKHLGGGWEFPGGKVERGEARIDSLTRELAEEVGVILISAHPLIRIRHTYPERNVDLDVWRVTSYEGTPRSLEAQAMRWCSRDELRAVDLISADRPVVTALVLPERITTSEGRHHVVGPSADVGRLRGQVCINSTQAAAAAASGAQFILASAVLGPTAIEAFTSDLNVPVYVRDVSLDVAWEYGASGVHSLAGS